MSKINRVGVLSLFASAFLAMANEFLGWPAWLVLVPGIPAAIWMMMMGIYVVGAVLFEHDDS